MAKVNEHKEWFRLIKSTTCSCGQKKTEVYSWGEYVYGKWRTVDHVCQSCFPRVAQRLQQHKDGCGCEFKLVSYRGTLPPWIKLEEVSCST